MPRKRRALEFALPWLICATGLAIWESGCILLRVPDFVLPRPSLITAALISNFRPLALNSLHTLTTTTIGFALAVVNWVVHGAASVAYVAAFMSKPGKGKPTSDAPTTEPARCAGVPASCQLLLRDVFLPPLLAVCEFSHPLFFCFPKSPKRAKIVMFLRPCCQRRRRRESGAA